jgi:hypothetical protein
VADTVQLLDELCDLETARQARLLSKPEQERWAELQRELTTAMCDFSVQGGSGAEERRATLRIPCPLEVTVASGGSTFKGTAIDLSAGGIGITAGILPALGEPVVLVSADEPPGTHFVLGLSGHVVWLRKLTHPSGAGFGIAFEPENETQRRHLAELLLFLLRRVRAGAAPSPR